MRKIDLAIGAQSGRHACATRVSSLLWLRDEILAAYALSGKHDIEPHP